MLNKFNLDTNKHIIISVIGRLSRQKGHKYLFDALRLIICRFSNLKVLLVGDGELREKLNQYVINSGIENNIIFCRHQENVAPFIENSLFTVLPSLWEGLGLAAIESLTLRKPVVAAAVGGLPEVIEHNVNGLLVPPKAPVELAEAIKIMINNPEKVREMGKMGELIAKNKFSISAMMNKYMQYYSEILSYC